MKPLFLLLAYLFATNFSSAQQFIKIWETDSILSGPESVVYDPIREFIYVGNFKKQDTSSSEGTECISKINLKGEIIELKWITNISEPLGITIFKDQLYIVERKNVAIYDLKNDQIIQRIFIDSCRVINDVAVGNDSTIYISECDTKITYAIKNGISKVWLDGDMAPYPNGILLDKNLLIVGACGDSTIKAIDMKTKEVSVIAQLDKGIIDGIKAFGNDYLVSFFEGNIFLVSKNGEVNELLNTRKQNMNIADFEFIEEKRMLIIPALNRNKLIAYQLQ